MREIITSKTVYSWEDVVNTPDLLEWEMIGGVLPTMIGLRNSNL